MLAFGSLFLGRNPFSKEYKQLLACCSCHIIEQKQAISWISTQNIVSLRMIKDKDHDTQGGYADIFLLPMIGIYKDILHSYIIELKYAKTMTMTR